MKLDIKFREITERLPFEFGEVNNVSDGGFERGYAEGYMKGVAGGYEIGYAEGHEEGLSERTYEVWTITLEDGSVVEKEVALL